MGDMADHHYDSFEEAMAERTANIERTLARNTDGELISLVKRSGFYKSEYTELVRAITKTEAKLTPKQRYALAAYIEDHTGNY